MKVLGKVLGVALASLIAMPGAQARPRLGLGVALLPLAIVGGIAGAAIGSRKARAHRSHYSRHHARRERGAIRQARPVAPDPEMARAMPIPDQSRDMPAPEQFRAQSAGWAGPLFWPHAYDGVFEYAFGLPGNDGQFWVRGFGDVIDGMFAPPPVRETIGRASNDGVRAWGSLCGNERSAAAPDITVARIREAVQPTEAQQAAIAELRTALVRATERIQNACPSEQAAAPPERLHLMVSRLTAMRQAVLTVQGPLRAFYDQLSDQQKQALERIGSDSDAGNARADANAGCAAPVANWPQAQIERVLQPTKAQRELLERLRQTALGLAQFVASTCPASAPRTAPERLEAVKDRLAVLRYAASNVSPAYEQFYASLSDAQKARLRSMSRERRAETRR